MKSNKPIKNLDDLMGKKTFFFPDSLANERVGNDNKRCILVRANGHPYYILTNENVELSRQEFAILKDSGIITDIYTYEKEQGFDPLV